MNKDKKKRKHKETQWKTEQDGIDEDEHPSIETSKIYKKSSGKVEFTNLRLLKMPLRLQQ